LEGVDTELGEVALVYLKMYDLVRSRLIKIRFADRGFFGWEMYRTEIAER